MRLSSPSLCNDAAKSQLRFIGNRRAERILALGLGLSHTRLVGKRQQGDVDRVPVPGPLPVTLAKKALIAKRRHARKPLGRGGIHRPSKPGPRLRFPRPAQRPFPKSPRNPSLAQPVRGRSVH